MKKTALNLPNTLSLIRCLLVPVFVAALIFMRDMGIWGIIVPALVYGLTALTDMLDGKIARKYNLITDFGKFIDPLADKFMVFASCITLLVIDSATAHIFVWVSAAVMLRELAVTSLRLVVAGQSGIVVAASFFGKCKTVTQVVAITFMLLEPVFLHLSAKMGITALASFFEAHILSYISMAAMAITTVASGIDYLKSYFPYIDTNK